MPTISTPLQMFSALVQVFLLLASLAFLLIFFADLRAWWRGARARHTRFTELLDLGILWKPK